MLACLFSSQNCLQSPVRGDQVLCLARTLLRCKVIQLASLLIWTFYVHYRSADFSEVVLYTGGRCREFDCTGNCSAVYKETNKPYFLLLPWRLPRCYHDVTGPFTVCLCYLPSGEELIKLLAKDGTWNAKHSLARDIARELKWIQK